MGRGDLKTTELFEGSLVTLLTPAKPVGTPYLCLSVFVCGFMHHRMNSIVEFVEVGEDGAMIAVKRVERRHIISAELKVKDTKVLNKTLATRTLRQRNAAMLNRPANRHLRPRLAISLSNLEHSGVTQKLATS